MDKFGDESGPGRKGQGRFFVGESWAAGQLGCWAGHSGDESDERRSEIRFACSPASMSDRDSFKTKTDQTEPAKEQSNTSSSQVKVGP